MSMQIKTTQALIGINRTPGKLEINNPAPVFEMHTEHPKLEMTSTKPKLHIDQSQSFAEAGRKTIKMLNAENAQNGKQQALASVAKTARQGRQLANIQDKGNPIASQAVENAYTQFDNEFGYAAIPRSRPKISVDRGEVDIRVQKGSVNINVSTPNVSYKYTKSKVETYLRQKNSIEFHYVDEKI